jgi:serine/threonine-protein kinase
MCNQSNRPHAKFCAHCRAPLFLQNKYRIKSLLGRGGFGAVYLAEQAHLGGALCAVKELVPDPNANAQQSQHATDQFQLEASILARLNHFALPRVTDFFFESFRFYLVMEYVEGETLGERLIRIGKLLDLNVAMAWADILCDVLHYLHNQNPPVIHRDINPRNIKIMPAGQLKLIDFGIAKTLQIGDQTATAARAVSPPYAPLEQYGTGTDARSDLYALGVTLYQLLTQCLVPEAPDRMRQPVVKPSDLNRALPGALDAILLKAIAINPQDRFQTAQEFKRALQLSLSIKPVAASSVPQPYVPASGAHLDPDRTYIFTCPSCGEFDDAFQLPDFGPLTCANCGEEFQEEQLAQTGYGSLAGEHTLGCSECGNYDDGFQVPELGLARCRNCDHTFSPSDLTALANGRNAGTMDFGCPECGEPNDALEIPEFGIAMCAACEKHFTQAEIRALANGALAGDRRFVCPQCSEHDDAWHVPAFGAARCINCEAVFPPAELARISKRKRAP